MRTYTVTQYNVHIPDSFEVSKHSFADVLGRIRQSHPDCEVWRRSRWSLKAEWAVHNALYGLGIARERTKDVDLNHPLPWYVEGAYIVFGTIVWVFIK